MRGAWAAAYLHHPQIGYLTIAYYFSNQLIIVAHMDTREDQPLFIDFNQKHERLIQELYKLGNETLFSQECENLGTHTTEATHK